MYSFLVLVVLVVVLVVCCCLLFVVMLLETKYTHMQSNPPPLLPSTATSGQEGEEEEGEAETVAGTAAAAAAAAASISPSTSVPDNDDRTVRASGNAATSISASSPALLLSSSTSGGGTTINLRSRGKNRSASVAAFGTAASTVPLTLDQQVANLKRQVLEEKAGKRKLFHSLVKLANELRRFKQDEKEATWYANQGAARWYDGGMWRAPQVLPAVASSSLLSRQAISLSDLFFNLVIVTAFTRVGVAISNISTIDTSRLLYFAMFWNVWSKETSYSTRFDTTDLSAQVVTLVSCFAVLFASLSVQASLDTEDGTRVMGMAAFVAALHCLLHVRVYITMASTTTATTTATTTTTTATPPLYRHVQHYAIFNIVMNLLETSVWCGGIFVLDKDWPFRWLIFVAGVLLALRVPRAFLANDFHAACSKRGVLFILLLGFLLQSIVVVASEFFTYQTPTIEHYAFVGAACLMLYCIKLLYVDDSGTLAEDHALLVNRYVVNSYSKNDAEFSNYLFFLSLFNLVGCTPAHTHACHYIYIYI
jgi:Bacterial low temperature requirement A protein (LtrA)